MTSDTIGLNLGAGGAGLGPDSLLDFSRLLNRAADRDAIYGAYLLSLIGRLGLLRAAVAVRDPESGLFVVTYTRGNVAHLVGSYLQLRSPSLISPPLSATLPFLPIEFVVAEEGSLDPCECGLHAILPIRFDEATLAIALLGRPMLHGASQQQESSLFALTDFDMQGADYATALSAVTAVAIEGLDVRTELRMVNRRLERRVRRLHSVFESGRLFDISLGPDEIVRHFGYTLMGEMAVTRFGLYLADGPEGPLHPVDNRFDRNLLPVELDRLIDAGAAIITVDSEPDLYPEGIRAIVPLQSRGDTRGLLVVGPRLRYDFDEEDLEYLGALGRLAVGAIENGRLLEEMIAKRRMEEDLRIAWEIQQGLLPPVPTIPDYSIAAGTLPAREVGGDSYDIIRMPSGRYLLTMADVSGKGAPASLLMANVQAAIRALASLDLPLDDLVGRINRLLVENTAADTFVTAIFCLLDPSTGELGYVNAGHNRPLLLTDSRTLPLIEGGLLLGVLADPPAYEVGSVTLAPGDRLFLFTDGVTEGVDPDGEEFGDERLVATLEELHAGGGDAETYRLALLERLADFTRSTNRNDDITTLVLLREGE